MLAFSNDYYGFIFRATQSVELFCAYDAILLPSKIVLDKPLDTHRPISATKDFWDEWDNNEPDNDAINEAIEALRKQCRG